MTPLLAIPIVILLLAALLAALNYRGLYIEQESLAVARKAWNETLEQKRSETSALWLDASDRANEAEAAQYKAEAAQRKAERLYKETLESLTVAQKGLDVQQAELESLREQSEAWVEMKVHLLAEIQRLQGELGRKNKEIVELRRERTISTGKIANLKDRLDKVDEQLAAKDRLIQGSRDANRRLRAKLTTIRECIDETQADA